MANADVKGTAQNINGNNQSTTKKEIDYLKSIDQKLSALLKNCTNTSQANARNDLGDFAFHFRDNMNAKTSSKFDNSNISSRLTGMIDTYLDEFEKQMLDSIVGDDLKKNIKAALNEFTDLMGMDLKDIPNALGKELAKQSAEAVKNSSVGKKFTETAHNFLNNIFNKAQQGFRSKMSDYAQSKGTTYENMRKAGQAKRAASHNVHEFETSRENLGRTHVPKSEGINCCDALLNILTDIDTNVKTIVDILTEQQTIPENLQDKFSDNDIIDVRSEDILNTSLSPTDLLSLPSGTGEIPPIGGELPPIASGTSTALTTTESTQIATVAPQLTEMASTVGPEIASGISGLASMMPEILIALLAIQIATAIIGKIVEGIDKLLDSIKEMFAALGKAANRYNESRKKNLEEQQKRMHADVETMIQAPYKIMEEAVQRITDVFDKNLNKIALTQGYNKSDVQDLMANFATRLRQEGLTDVVAGTDIIDNLSNVLQQGLSGRVAEEFAYQASKLNAAIPTQDFFQYAQAYAELAATAMLSGKSQQEAIAYANQQLELFASNILYASRQLTGGFSTGLTNASALFESAVKIAQTSRVGDVAHIGGVLASVAGVIGAVAPDLASSIVDAVVNAAIGGNTDSIVALRSLAGINASNTEFLRMIATNPQQIFADMFAGLAAIQDRDSTAFMERAEALSGVFGVSMDALARVDFKYLADAISSMQVNDIALNENMNLLKSGQATTTAEQLRMHEINKYMIDKGLAYVLDNQVAREIQKHMWDEQLAREMQEATYAVDLQGSALKFLEDIRSFVDNILNFLNPFKWLGKLANLVRTGAEGAAQRADILQLLELGKVGTGNARALYQLTTPGQDLHLWRNIVDMMGGISAYGAISEIGKIQQSFFHIFNTALDFSNALPNMITAGILGRIPGNTGVQSAYKWKNVGKSALVVPSILGQLLDTSNIVPSIDSSIQTTSNVAAQSKVNKNLEQMLSEEYMSQFAGKTGGGFEAWKASSTKFNISSSKLMNMMEEAGYSTTDIMNRFGALQAAQAHEQEEIRKLKEEEFWKFVPEKQDAIYALIQDITNDLYLKSINDNLATYLKEWTDFYINHTYYNDKFTFNASDVSAIEQAEQTDAKGAVYALAEALTTTATDLKDPTLQTNAILSQILLVVNAIMQQKNTVGGLSLPDAFAALALGITQPTP